MKNDEKVQELEALLAENQEPELDMDSPDMVRLNSNLVLDNSEQESKVIRQEITEKELNREPKI